MAISFKYLSYFVIAASMTLSSCSNDDAPDAPKSPYVMFGMADTQSVVEWQRHNGSRGGESTVPAPEMPATIGVYGVNNATGQASAGYGQVFSNEQMYLSDVYGYDGFDAIFPNNDNHWPYYDPRPWVPNAQYKFFAYGPYTSDVSVVDESFAALNTAVFSRLPYYSDQELLVSNSLVEYTSVSAGNTVQHFTLTHPLARVRLCFKLGPKYAEMRKVHITKIEVSDPRKNTFSLTVKYVKDGDVYKPTYEWGQNSELLPDGRTVELKPEANVTDAGYLELSEDNNKLGYQPYGSLYACTYRSSSVSSMTIYVTYDVYDLTDQLLRKDNTVTNNINLKDTYSLQPGYCYDINLVVEPTFLYVLSDNDPDPTAQGYLVINDNK